MTMSTELDQRAALAFAANVLRTLSAADDSPAAPMTGEQAMRLAARKLDAWAAYIEGGVEPS